MTTLPRPVPAVKSRNSNSETSPKSEFLSAFQQFILAWPNISRDESVVASKMIAEHYVAHRFVTEGPCFICFADMLYGGVSSVHRTRGNAWIAATIEKWKALRPAGALKSSVRIEPKAHRGAQKKYNINGQSLENASFYICGSCRDTIVVPAIELYEAKTSFLYADAVEKARDRNAGVIAGRIPATPSQRFRILGLYLATMTLPEPQNRDYIQELRSMPYAQFLRTDYWSIVRGKVIYDRRGTCELCNSSTSLNVHHRTYQYHGQEHLHLESLVLLCHPCHAKFHDKLAKEETG